MKAKCRKLSQDADLETATEIKDPLVFWKWSGEKELKWWNDRPILFASPCVSKDIGQWKNYLKYENVRSKTLRHNIKGRLTKRLGIKKLLENK